MSSMTAREEQRMKDLEELSEQYSRADQRKQSLLLEEKELPRAGFSITKESYQLSEALANLSGHIRFEHFSNRDSWTEEHLSRLLYIIERGQIIVQKRRLMNLRKTRLKDELDNVEEQIERIRNKQEKVLVQQLHNEIEKASSEIERMKSEQSLSPRRNESAPTATNGDGSFPDEDADSVATLQHEVVPEAAFSTCNEESGASETTTTVKRTYATTTIQPKSKKQKTVSTIGEAFDGSVHFHETKRRETTTRMIPGRASQQPIQAKIDGPAAIAVVSPNRDPFKSTSGTIATTATGESTEQVIQKMALFFSITPAIWGWYCHQAMTWSWGGRWFPGCGVTQHRNGMWVGENRKYFQSVYVTVFKNLIRLPPVFFQVAACSDTFSPCFDTYSNLHQALMAQHLVHFLQSRLPNKVWSTSAADHARSIIQTAVHKAFP